MAKATKKNPKQSVTVHTRASLSRYDFEGSEADVIRRIQEVFESARVQLRHEHKLFQIPAEWEMYLDERERRWDDGSDWIVAYRRPETDEEYDKRMADVAERKVREEAAQRKQYEELAKKYGK